MTTAKEFSARDVRTVLATDTVQEAARRMREHHVGALVIVSERDGARFPVGVLTDRDIVVGAVAAAADHLPQLAVGDIVSDRTFIAREDDPIDDVLKRMKAYGVRRMPVVDAAGALAGLVSFDDVLQRLAGQVADLAWLVSRERRHEVERRP